jgi:hypothetical protein
MNQFACTIVPLVFLISSPSLSLKAFSTPLFARASQTTKASQTKAYVKGWDVTVTTVRYLGRQVQGKYELYEAADSWIAVTVTCTNTTGKRQRSDESPMSSISAELIDTYGRKHNVKERELKYDTDLLSKPYELNESRTEVWLFDVNSGTQASQLILDSFDENGVRLTLW